MTPPEKEKPQPSRGSQSPPRTRPSFALWPLVFCIGAVLFYAFHTELQAFAPAVEIATLHTIGAVAIFYSFAWLLAHGFGVLVARKRAVSGRRKAPKLLRELVSVALFTIATMLALGMLLGGAAGGVLASSGLIIAILGFAIRNVLADVLAGLALGLEAPFRIGDWVEFDTATTGRVTEIGWRTTRILTPDDTYMILPNSQISRQMLTNYSAPRKYYQASVRILLGHDIPVSRAKTLLYEASRLALENPGMVETQKAIVRATLYEAEGITYTIKYWVSNFAYDMECRDAMLAAIDETIRRHEAPART